MPRILVLWCLLAVPAAAQLGPEQRRNDFEQLAAFVAKAYAPYEWKRDALGFDAFDLKPWLPRVAAAPDDIAYFEICMEYVSSLRDLHSGFFLPSDFLARIDGIGVDLYDGKALIDRLDRTFLPASRYPFEIGDEVVSIDGVSAEQWMDRTGRLQSFADARATRRWALDQWFFRDQSVLPRAHQVGDSARVVVRRRATGQLETYELTWVKTGTPFERVGPVSFPRSARETAAAAQESWRPGARYGYTERRAPREKRLRGFGLVAPVFTLPDGFVQRYGRQPGDLIYSGSYLSEGRRIGFLRIPSFPSGFSGLRMLQQVAAEVGWFRGNTDVLVVDVMRNPGGDVCTTNDLLRSLIPYRFLAVADEYRPTKDTVDRFRYELEDMISFGADPVDILFMQEYVKHVETAYSEFRGRTGSIPACGYDVGVEPFRDDSGLPLAYDKPLLVLVDEFSASSADVFPAILQDASRARLLGKPTAGGGGIPVNRVAGVYGESGVRLSSTLGVRPRTVESPGLPATNYIENVGARPEIEVDFMTLDNLLTRGQPFVAAFTQAAVQLAQAGAVRLPQPASSARHGRAE